MIRSRTRLLLASVVAALALGACRPLPHPPVPVTPAPPAAGLSVSSSSLARSGSVDVSVTGCADDFQYVEVRLVVGSGDRRASAAVTTGWSGEPIPVEVPGWAPTGPAAVEGSCLEPNFSGASDGADVKVFDFPAVPVTIGASPAPTPRSLVVRPVATGGTLRISGSDCPGGRVLVAVSRGPWLVASAARFNYGRTIVQAAPDGTWSAEIPLRYSVGVFSDPVAPGTLAAFAACDGEWYPPRAFEVVGTQPGIHFVGPDPSLVQLSQCPVENTVTVLGVVTLQGGARTLVVHSEPGGGYGETFVAVPVPAGAVEVTYVAACAGAFDPVFLYETTTWRA